jgi:hypothetical protein
MIPKKTSEMITIFVVIVRERLSIRANPPAIIIMRIIARLKDDDQKDNLLLSFS